MLPATFISCIIMVHLVCMGVLSAKRTQKIKGNRGSGIQDIVAPMCSNFLPYNTTKLPNSFGHKTQLKIYSKFPRWCDVHLNYVGVVILWLRRLERLWSTMDNGCSANLRLLACSLYLPKYDVTTGQSMGPCKSTCKEAKKRCKRHMKRWPRQFRCKKMPTEESTCIPPFPATQFQPEHAFCTLNPAPICGALPYIRGSLPNIFFQSSVTEIRAELQHYNRLVASGCSHKAAFFLCGTFMPYCIHELTRPFAMPCREVCEEVHRDCGDTYTALYRGLPWPTKLTCDRFPSADDTSGDACVLS